LKLLNKFKHPEPFGTTIVPKGYFQMKEGFGTKFFLIKTFYNQLVREKISQHSIGTQIALYTFQGRKPKKTYILQKQMIYLTSSQKLF
jgi:hypothetical protein